MCTEYLFDGEEVDTVGRVLQLVRPEPLAWYQPEEYPETPEKMNGPESCLCGLNVKAAALASGWVETDPPDGDDWYYGGVFKRAPQSSS